MMVTIFSGYLWWFIRVSAVLCLGVFWGTSVRVCVWGGGGGGGGWGGELFL